MNAKQATCQNSEPGMVTFALGTLARDLRHKSLQAGIRQAASEEIHSGRVLKNMRERGISCLYQAFFIDCTCKGDTKLLRLAGLGGVASS